jgi:hypothetical protein
MHDRRYKYPRTPHLPFSPGVGADDIKLNTSQNFQDSYVVVTEKLDGENTTLYCDYLHARSIDSRHHPSRTWIKALHAAIAKDIPPGWRFCGENVYARHSIAYEGLKSYFYLFSIWDDRNRCLSWSDTQEWAEILELELPTVFYQGLWQESIILELTQNIDSNRCEGFVVRTIEGFDFNNFDRHVAKWVRNNHVQTDEHWMQQEVIPNGLIS